MGEPQPLLIKPGTTEFFDPQGSDGIIRLNNNQQLELFCSGGFTNPAGASGSITVTCTSGNQFSFSGTSFPFSSFVCSAYPIHIARRTGGRCFNNGVEVEIGFEVGSSARFLQVMSLCHDEVTEETYFVKHKFTPANAAFQIGKKELKKFKFSMLIFKFNLKDFHVLIGLQTMEASLAEKMLTLSTLVIVNVRPSHLSWILRRELIFIYIPQMIGRLDSLIRLHFSQLILLIILLIFYRFLGQSVTFLPLI